MGYYHFSFAQPRFIEPKLRARWLKEGWPLNFPAANRRALNADPVS